MGIDYHFGGKILFVLIANLLTPLRASGPKTHYIQDTKCSGESRGEARGKIKLNLFALFTSQTGPVVSNGE